MSEEITLDIKDLCYRILLKWKSIIAFALIFALLGGLAGIAKDYKAVWDYNNEDKEQELEDDRIELLELKEELTERQLQDVKDAVEAYDQFHKEYEDVQYYREHSVIMELNPNAVSSLTIRYMIDTHYQVEYPLINKKDYSSDIINSYASYIMSDEVLDKICADGIDIEKKYLRELIGVAGNTGDIFTIEIIGTDEEMCRNIAESIKQAVESKTDDFRKTYCNYDFAHLNEDYQIKSRSDILDKQQGQLNTINSLRNSWMGLAGNMTAEQKEYYTALIDYRNKKSIFNDEKLALEGKAAENSEVVLITDEELEDEEPEVDYIQLKLILLGFIFGAFIVCGWVLVLYILKPVIRVKENISDAYKIPLLGSVWVKEAEMDGIAKKLTRLFYGNECDIEFEKRVEMISTGIAIQMKKAGFKKLYITGTAAVADDVKKLIISSLSKEFEVAAGGSVCFDPASLEALSQHEAVVFVERIDVSRYDELTRQFELAARAKTQVLGAIVVNQ